MIIDTILNIFFSVLTFFIGLFPNANTDFVSNVNTAMINFRVFIAQINFVFPLGTLFSILVVWFIINNTSYAAWTINWVINKLRGAG